MAEAALIIGAAAALGSGIYQGLSSHQQADQAKQTAARQESDQQRALAEAKKREAQEAQLQKAALSRDLARQNQKTQAGLMAGRQGTIIAGQSPLSPTSTTPTFSGSFSGGGKTLLGS